MTGKENILERPPIIVVMGHVDHGKSSLLDYIRKTNVVAGEAGGITQHVAAYEVVHESPEHGTKKITFIDTPGHAAFSAIRSRGANVADIAILVVSAEEGVKEQTKEALRHIQESDIPFVVAINKIDKSAADIERTKVSLLESEVLLEGFGGTTPWVAISAKTGTGIPELLDTLLLLAALEELKGDASKSAEGFVLEAHRDPRRGVSATLIITDGSLETGMAVRAGSAIAPLRLIEDHAGKPVREARFSSPLMVVGFDELPEVGSPFVTHKNKKEAEAARKTDVAAKSQDTHTDGEESSAVVIPFVIKADAAGSLEAVTALVERLAGEKTRPRVISRGIGAVGEGDIKQAVASGAKVFAFTVGSDAPAVELARQHGVTIEYFDIIYRLEERVREILATAVPIEKVEERLGIARVIKTFSRSKDIALLGGSVMEGTLRVGKSVRIMRRKVPVGMGLIVNLQAHRQNVDKIETGSEFGAQIESSFEIAAGDVMECFQVVER